MKFGSLLLAALTLFASTTFAQDEEVGQSVQSMRKEQATSSIFLIAPVVGYASTGYTGIQALNGASLKDQQSVTGGMAIILGKGYWQLETGLIHSTIANRVEINSFGLGGSMSQTSTSTYLDVPVLARWTFLGDRRFRLFAKMGVVTGFLLDGQVKSSYTQNGFYQESERNQKSAFHDTNVKAAVGLGASYRITADLALGSSVDYQEGITKLTTSELYDQIDVKSRSLGLNIYLGYRI